MIKESGWKEYRRKLKELEDSENPEDIYKLLEMKEPLLSEPFQFFGSYLSLN